MNLTAVLAVAKAPFASRMRRESAYLLLTVIPALIVFPVALVGIVASVLSVFGIGLPFLVLVLFVARQIGRIFEPLARLTLGWRWPPPAAHGATGLSGRARALLSDSAAWKALGYAFVKFPLTVVTVYLSGIGVVAGGLALTSPLWWPVAGSDFGPFGIEQWSSTLGLAMQGLAVFLAAPWFVRAMVGIDRRLAHALLAPDPNRERIVALEAGRRTLEADATDKLRRIERDLHDGTQARFVLLGLAMSRLEDRIVDDDTRAMINSAQQIVHDGTNELREIIRGMRPPALDDSLETALTSLASNSPIITTFHHSLATRPSAAAATILYFAATELLSNAARHAEATIADIRLGETADGFVLSVSDDGIGGADPNSSGTGLDGLRRRADALDGTLTIDSPDGGPTVVVVTLPNEQL